MDNPHTRISMIALTGAFMLFSCQSDLQTIEAITKIDAGPVESAFDVEIVYSDQAHVRMILHTPRMDRYEGEEPYLELPQGLEVVFYDTLKRQTSFMTAKYAISHEDSEIIEARNDVVVINEAGEKLNTEHLTWDQKQGIIYSDKFVRITTEEEVLYGEGFESDERFDQWTITRPRGTFKVDTRPESGPAGERGPPAMPRPPVEADPPDAPPRGEQPPPDHEF